MRIVRVNVMFSNTIENISSVTTALCRPALQGVSNGQEAHLTIGRKKLQHG